MRKVKIIAIFFLCYVTVVAIFESLLAYFQPTNSQTLKIITYAEGEPKTRVVNKLYSDEALYVAANHWPRRWYYEAIKNPKVGIKLNDEIIFFRAIPTNLLEDEKVSIENPLPLSFRLLTGFPPRKFLRLEKIDEPINS